MSEGRDLCFGGLRLYLACKSVQRKSTRAKNKAPASRADAHLSMLSISFSAV